MAATLNPIAVEWLPHTRWRESGVTFVSATGFKVAQLFAGGEVVHRLLFWLEVGAPKQPVNNFGEAIRGVKLHHTSCQ